MFTNKYPYTDFHELNLDWILSSIRELASQMEGWQAANTITYGGTWSIDKAYQAWTVVVDGDNGYISKKAVPYGIALTNTEYWENIADFSSLYADLGTRVGALEADMAIVKPQSELDHQTIQANQLKVWDAVVWIGDSYTSAGSLGPDVDKRYSTLVSEELGLYERNYAVGGTGYIAGTTPFTTQINNAVTDYMNQGYDRTKVKYVFVMGNRNDADYTYSYADYSAAVGTVINTAKNYFTTAKIVIIPALWDGKPCKSQLIRYASIIEETSIPYYDKVLFFSNAWTWLMGNEDKILYQNGADVHPDVNGHKLIANHVINCLKGNNYSDVKYYAFTPTTTDAAISDCTMFITIVNNTAYFKCRFKTSSDTLSGSIIEHNFNGLTLSNLFITNTQIFTEVKNQLSDVRPQVTVNQTLTKSSDTVGSLYTNIYCYAGGTQFDTTHYNWIEFSLPYGIKPDTYND